MKLPHKLIDWVAPWLVVRAMRTPYFHLEGYMNRFWLVPYADARLGAGCGLVKPLKRPFAWILQKFGIAVRIHQILRSDLDRHYHDHPWWYVSVILLGGYFECYPEFNKSGTTYQNKRRLCLRGSVHFRSAKSWHRLDVPREAWTLFITGPKQQTWGFLTAPVSKRAHHEYLKDEV